MPIVTESLLTLIRAQIKARGTAVWYDPEGVYRDLAQTLTPEQVSGARICCYTPEIGFLRLRHDLETLWGAATEAPRLLIYVPLAQTATQHALIEFEAGGVVLRSGQQPQERNTALAFVARQALEKVFPSARLAGVLADIEAGRLSLAELDQLAERVIDDQAGVLKIVYGAGVPVEIALRFLSEPQRDAELEARSAGEALAELLSGMLGVAFAPEAPGELRARLARQLLLSDFLLAAGAEAPAAYQTFPLAQSDAARETAVSLAAAWRNRRDLTQSYVEWAEKTALNMGLALPALVLPLGALARMETFAIVETALQTAVETALCQHPSAELLTLAQQRRERGFWPAYDPALKLRWDVIITAAEVLLHAARVRNALKGKSWSAEALLGRYVHGGDEHDAPWCALDTAQRQLERDAHRFDFEPHKHESLHRLIARARQAYAETAGALAQAFVKAYAEASFTLSGVLQQADLFHEVVAPEQQKGRVAYLLVDALRYEMARELESLLESEWATDLSPALATPPTITEIGMAALLPGAEQGVTLVESNGKLALAFPGATLKTRQERVAHFLKVVGNTAVVAKLEQLAPLADPTLARALDHAPIALITATEEIDGLCESNPALARRMLDDSLTQLRRGLKTLFERGFHTAIITADHGYLFGESIAAGETIDAPGGKTVALKRRVWVGRGGAQATGYLRTPVSAFGIGGDLELATPWNLSVFKAPGGALEYFHGGLALPEVVIPVLIVHATAVGAPPPGAAITWNLKPGSEKISTRFVSFTLSGQTGQLLPLEPPCVRVELRAGNDAISTPISASYGFSEATKDVQLQLDEQDPTAIAANTITLMLTSEPNVTQVNCYVLDASTGVTLARLDDISFALTF